MGKLTLEEQLKRLRDLGLRPLGTCSLGHGIYAEDHKACNEWIPQVSKTIQQRRRCGSCGFWHFTEETDWKYWGLA